MERIVQLVFVLSFKDKHLKTIKQDTILKVIVDAGLRAISSNRIDVYFGIIRLFTFFSDD